MRRAPPRTIMVAGAALLLFGGALALFWPGIAMYDSVGQFGQALSGDYSDWHPPIMARLWAALHAAFGGTGEPMLVLQMTLYWAGFGLVATVLARDGRTRAAGAVLAVAALPLFPGWQAVVLKDTQLLGAALAACGIVAWWRLRPKPEPVPVPVLALVAVLLGYATLVRANGAFATVPLAVLLFGPRRWWMRWGSIAAGVAAVLAIAPIVNHGLFAAAPTGIERTEALYDLAGIAVRAPDSPDAPVGVTRAQAQALVARHCVKPFFWDPLGEPSRCAPILARLRDLPPGQLYRLLAEAIVREPVAYAAHRLAHWNSTERWLVAAGLPGAAPPGWSEPNALGLRSPGGAAQAWQVAARWTAETPLGWPIAWVTVAIVGTTVAAARTAGPLRDLALALLVSALALEASFAVLSIASDLRYHLWPMVATALASVLLSADAPWPRRALVAGGAALAAVVVTGIGARLLLPPAPSTYQAQLR